MDNLVESMMEAEYAATRARVRANPAHAELVAAADAETGEVWFNRNRLALQVEIEMPGIQEMSARIRASRPPRTWSQRFSAFLGLPR